MLQRHVASMIMSAKILRLILVSAITTEGTNLVHAAATSHVYRLHPRTQQPTEHNYNPALSAMPAPIPRVTRASAQTSRHDNILHRTCTPHHSNHISTHHSVANHVALRSAMACQCRNIIRNNTEDIDKTARHTAEQHTTLKPCRPRIDTWRC